MKKILFLLFFVYCYSCAKAQLITNYVKNPGFEEYFSCPTTINQIKLAKWWSSVDSLESPPKGGCLPEYCNECATSISGVKVPYTGMGYQYARSGKGMTHGYYFCDETPPPPAPHYTYRDYLQGRLHKSLKGGKEYCVTYYINLSEGTTYATNKMGAYLDDGSIDTVSICSKPITFVKPQVYTNKVIDDTLNWVKIEGSFIANGTERFITLGNFFPIDSITHTVPFGIIAHQWAYYFIDDVSVIESDLPADAGADKWVEMGKQVEIGRVGDSTAIGLDCKWYKKGVLIDSGAIIKVNASGIKYDTDTYVVVQTICGLVKTDTVTVRTVGLGVKEIREDNEFLIYPNPGNGNIIITSPHAVIPTKEGTLSAKVYDLLGRIVQQQNLSFNDKESNLNLHLPSATYILELQDEEGSVQHERIVIE